MLLQAVHGVPLLQQVSDKIFHYIYCHKMMISFNEIG